MQHSIIFWNVSRLFGSSGSPIQFALSADSEESHASTTDVDKKLDVIAAVVDAFAADNDAPPLFVGFTEIENGDLAEAIANRVQSAPLKVVDHLATDETGFALDGLNITALVNTDLVSVVRLRSHILDRTFDTRDILEIDCQTNHTNWCALVNHWPSRLVGEARSQRVAAAHYLKQLVHQRVRFPLSQMWDRNSATMRVPANQNLLARSRTPVVVMGDFNDEVFNEAIEQINSTPDSDQVISDLKVRGRSTRDRFRSYRASPFRLINPFWQYAPGSMGSYYRSPRWRTYDQILMSRSFIDDFDGQTFKFDTESAMIINRRRVTLGDNYWQITNNNGKPIQFDSGKNRGCSDHFPVAVVVDIMTSESANIAL